MPIAVDVRHGHAAGPSLRPFDPGSVRDVLEPKVAPVEVQPVWAEVRGQVQISEAVVVDVPRRDAATVVVVQVVQDVELAALRQLVDEGDARLLRTQELEQRRRALGAIARGERHRGTGDARKATKRKGEGCGDAMHVDSRHQLKIGDGPA
jgi:hypothetical protein